jgi:hypothetical protein
MFCCFEAMPKSETTGRNGMKKNKTKFQKLLPLIITVLSLVAVLVAAGLLRQNQAVADWMTDNVARRVSGAMGKLTSRLSFSLFEWSVVFFFSAIITLLVFFVRAAIKKKGFKIIKGFLITAVAVLAILDVYTLTAGMAYYRGPLALPIYDGDYNKTYGDEEVKTVAEIFLKDFAAISQKMQRDELGRVISPYNTSELNALLSEEFKRLDKEYFFEYTPNAKSMTNSWFLAMSGIWGITFVPYGEANVSAYVPPSYVPYVTAHEMAHAKGVMRENEAELVSCYLLITSENEYLRYSGYFSWFNSLKSAYLLNFDASVESAWTLPDEIYAEYRAKPDYWWEKGILQHIKNAWSNVNDFINNIYLKSNGAENGTGSYDNPSGTIDTGKIVPGTEEHDPDTGEIIPGTGVHITEPVYSDIHRIFFYVYETNPAWLKG